MCTKGILEKYTRLFSLIQVPFFFVACLISLIGATDDITPIAIGSAAGSRFSLLTFMALSGMGGAYCGVYGSKSHNKFCLSLFVIHMLTIFTFATLFEGMTTREISPVYSSEFQKNCSFGTSQDVTISTECKAYISDSTRESYRNMWYTLFVQARDGKGGGQKYIAIMEEIQSLGSCCGFDPPYRCWFGENKKDSPFSDEGSVPSFCGEELGWYPPTYDCDFEVVEVPGVVYRPGCPYHLPGGTCLKFEYDSGCASTTQIWVVDKILPRFQTIKLLFIVGVISASLSCCLCMKRKESDVLPTTFVQYQVEEHIKMKEKNKKGLRY